MEEKNIFSGSVRAIGLLSLGRGIYDLLYVFLYYLNLSEVSLMLKAPNADLIFGLIYFLIGLYMIRGAPIIVNFAFPKKEHKGEPEQNLVDGIDGR